MKKGKKVKVFLIIFGLLIVGAVIIGPQILGGGPQRSLTEATAVKQDLIKYYSFSGNIESHDVQNLLAKSSDSVKKFYVQEGDIVAAGDLLYEIDDLNTSSNLTQAQTTLANANTSKASKELAYTRMEKLYEVGGVTLEDLETARDALSTARNQVIEAQSNLTQARKTVDDTRAYAEISGEVTDIYINENESVVMGTAIMDIVDYDHLDVKVKVDEYDIASVAVGKEVEVYIESLGLNLTGKISDIAREATVESGVSYFLTTVSLPQNDTLRIGLSAEIKLVSQSVLDAVVIPAGAVTFNAAGKATVQLSKNGEIQTKEVTTGINNGVLVEIKEGLSAGDVVMMEAEATTEAGGLQGGPPRAGQATESGNQ